MSSIPTVALADPNSGNRELEIEHCQRGSPENEEEGEHHSSKLIWERLIRSTIFICELDQIQQDSGGGEKGEGSEQTGLLRTSPFSPLLFSSSNLQPPTMPCHEQQALSVSPVPKGLCSPRASAAPRSLSSVHPSPPASPLP